MTDPSAFLEQRIERFTAAEPTVLHCSERLRAMGIRVCSFTQLPATATKSLLTLTNTTLRRLMDEVVAVNPGYRWEEPKPGLINLWPEHSVLDTSAPRLVVRSKGAWRVLEEDVNIESLGITIFQEFGDPNGPPIDLELEEGNLRTALNQIVEQLAPLVWHITSREGEAYLSFTNVPE
jgi:hypothetical protein